jgi:pyridoxamine 5'-phosphate oxidase
MNDDLVHRRITYSRHTLDVADVASDPFAQFASWLEDAARAGIAEPGAMTLASADERGHPSARIVLLRGVDARGMVFFTNYQSRKGREFAANPHAALLWYWAPLERQIRLEGTVAMLDAAESDAYFAQRPRDHRLGAWASPQSAVIPDRVDIDARMERYAASFADSDVPRPPHWGGYRVAPSRFEFWQGRPNRMHDRIVYRRVENGTWLIERLAP